MEKINLTENFKKGLSLEESIKKFYSQVFEDEMERLKDSKLSEEEKKLLVSNSNKRKLDDLVIKERYLDPRLQTVYVYCVCSQEEINKLISFGEDYVSYKKEIKKITKLRRHKTMKFDLYEINFKEDEFKTSVRFRIIVESQGDFYAKSVLIAEDDLYYARAHLDYCDVLF